MQVFVVSRYRNHDVHFGTIDDVIEVEESYIDSVFDTLGKAQAHALAVDGYVETFEVK